MIEYSLEDFQDAVEYLFDAIKNSKTNLKAIYGIPRGGIPLAVALGVSLDLPLIELKNFTKYKRSEILIVDDLIDSGKTIKAFDGYPVAVLGIKDHAAKFFPDLQFAACYFPNEWIHFWWEPKAENDIESSVVRLIEYIGDDITREGLVETPKRVIKSFDRIYGGYEMDPEKIMKTFSEDDCDEMVVLKDITMHSTCEHHMLPFNGVAHIAYIPNGRVIGVSKLARLLEIYSRRLQIQERIGEQVTNALMKYLKPKGAACVIEARHSCMTARGVEQQTSTMVTSSIKGVFKEKQKVRAEFLGFIK